MPDRGFDTIFKFLDGLHDNVKRKAVEGATRGADVLEDEAKQTTAYLGMSGATRASTVAYVATTEDDGQDKVSSAYTRAQQALDGFTEHRGKALLEDSGLTPNDDQVMIVLTVPTDYIEGLETWHAGQKAFLGDTLIGNKDFVAALIADAIKDVFN